MPRSLKKEKYHHFGPFTAKELSRSRFSVTGPHRFTLNLLEDGKWRVSGADSRGSYKRAILYAPTLGEAVEMALVELHGTKSGDPRDLPLADAFAEWDRTLTVQDATRQRYRWDTIRFLERMEARGITRLGQIQRNHLQQYLASLKDFDFWTRKHAIKPVRAMFLWASLNWPGVIHDLARGIKIRDTGPQFPDDKVHLSFRDLGVFLFWLREQPGGWMVLPGVALQGYAGLRVTEVHRLKWDSINLELGTVTVQGIVKGRDSVRTIPVAGWILDILQEAPRAGERILSAYGKWNEYAVAVKRFLSSWGKAPGLEPKGLRRTLESEATERGWDGYIFNRYLGRSAKGIQEKHYIAVGNQLPDLYQGQVVFRLDEVLSPYRKAWNRAEEKVVPLRKKEV